MRGPRPRPGLKIIKFPAAAGNFISRGRARRTSDDVGSAPKPSQYAVGEGVEDKPLRRARARYPHLIHIGTNPSVTPLRGATAPLSGEPRAWAEAVALSHLLPTIPMPPFRAYGLALRI